VGVPGRYGGFETLADNLVQYHEKNKLVSQLTVFCSGKSYPEPRAAVYRTARLRYLPLYANGLQSIPYDIFSMMLAILRGENRILLLGVSGAIGIPIARLFPWVKIVVNIDGIEWRRAKWSRLARSILRFSEQVAVRFSHKVVADNQGIADYVAQRYGRQVEVIAYGGDHALGDPASLGGCEGLPGNYALALCRIEPENNVELILDAWTKLEAPLVFVGNWGNSGYGRDLKKRFEQYPLINLVDPVYDSSRLRALRDSATLYVHGHSAGGTNPSLVEMMHFGIPVAAWNCNFNRYSTDDAAIYFSSADELVQLVSNLGAERGKDIGQKMRRIAQERYTWSQVAKDYYKLLEE
jgi:glycosyltransferase involved in cell wall biosynthesis